MEGIDNVFIKFSRLLHARSRRSHHRFITRGTGFPVTGPTARTPASHAKEESAAGSASSGLVDIQGYLSDPLAIASKFRDGLVVDVASVISNMKVPLRSLNARDLNDATRWCM